MVMQHFMFVAIEQWNYQIMAYVVPVGYVVYYIWFIWSRRCLIREYQREFDAARRKWWREIELTVASCGRGRARPGAPQD